jgi:hypothetical protein
MTCFKIIATFPLVLLRQPAGLPRLVTNPSHGGLIWYKDGSKTSKGTGVGVYGYGTRGKLSFSLGQYTTVFQAEVFIFKACVTESLDRNYRNRSICICSDSEVAIKALSNYRIT